MNWWQIVIIVLVGYSMAAVFAHKKFYNYLMEGLVTEEDKKGARRWAKILAVLWLPWLIIRPFLRRRVDL